jgi:hypothetical protein
MRKIWIYGIFTEEIDDYSQFVRDDFAVMSFLWASRPMGMRADRGMGNMQWGSLDRNMSLGVVSAEKEDWVALHK